MKETLKKAIAEATGYEGGVHLEHPDDLSHGDYATNIALALAKAAGKNPRELGEEIAEKLREKNIPFVSRIEVAGPGFVNFFLSRDFFSRSIEEVLKKKENFGKGSLLEGKLALFEYTDPNPFKAFHIGHLMANAVGEALSRLAGFQGANVKRVCYQGDIGLHVAKTIWAMKEMGHLPSDDSSFDEKVKYMGDAYVKGTNAYEDDSKAAEEIKAINKALFEKSDKELQTLYDKGRKWSLEYFESIYEKLDTKFNDYIFESEVSALGKEIVTKNVPNIFSESDGAIVFKGEEHGLHTRVFLTSQGLPTYEAKELANAVEKAKRFKFDISIITSANEITDYFKVVKCVMNLLDPENAERTHFVPHGMLRFAEGKMSSRKGNIITGESLINDTENAVFEKIGDRDIPEGEKKDIATKVAIGAIKFSILRQSPGKDVIFDREKSVSFEGDSGPYLQYSYVRTLSLLAKARSASISPSFAAVPESPVEIEKLLYRFPEVAERAWEEKAPQMVVDYMLGLSSVWNSFYASTPIVTDSPEAPYRVALAEAFGITLKNALSLLGIPTPEKM